MLLLVTALATRDRMFEEELFWMIESGSPFLGRADLLIPNLSSPFSSLETQMFRNEFKELGNTIRI